MFMYKQTQNTHTTELLTDYHHTSIIKLSVRWCVWNVREGYPDWV